MTTTTNTPEVATPKAQPAVKATPKTENISRTKAIKLIEENKNKGYFTVSFMEKNKSRAKNAKPLVARTMTCRTGVKKYLASNQPTAAGQPARKTRTVPDVKSMGFLSVYEATGDKGYKLVNLQTLKGLLKIAGGVYNVK